MGPEKWKGEVPPREAAEQEAEAARRQARKEGAGEQTWEDQREEEGWTQPESSAQKQPEEPGGS